MTEITLSRMHVGELHESPQNPREIGEERFEALKHALDADPSMLEARPIIADADNGEVVCGNMRLRAARALGWDTVPVYLHEFTSQNQKREWMLRDNQEYGNWVPDDLARLVAEHENAGGDMSLLGFSNQELDDLRKLESGDLPPTGEAPEDDVPTIYGVIVECASEEEQADLLTRLTEEGHSARALLV